MRRPGFGFALALGVFLLAPASGAQAQVGTGFGSDPFSLYFGYYLPHQAAVAAQSTPLDTINAATAARANQAVTDRQALYDPISPFGEDDLDPLRPYSRRERIARAPGFATAGVGASRGSLGPAALYFNRTARYYPTIKPGRGPNRNLAVTRGNRGGFGGMPSAPSMPGPR